MQQSTVLRRTWNTTFDCLTFVECLLSIQTEFNLEQSLYNIEITNFKTCVCIYLAITEK